VVLSNSSRTVLQNFQSAINQRLQRKGKKRNEIQAIILLPTWILARFLLGHSFESFLDLGTLPSPHWIQPLASEALRKQLIS